jgi:hypothetical protein
MPSFCPISAHPISALCSEGGQRRAAGSSTITFTCSGVGRSEARAAGTCTITFTCSGGGGSLSGSAGSCTITFTTAGAGRSLSRSAGACDFTFTPTGVGRSNIRTAGSTSFAFTVAGVGYEDLDARYVDQCPYRPFESIEGPTLVEFTEPEGVVALAVEDSQQHPGYPAEEETGIPAVGGEDELVGFAPQEAEYPEKVFVEETLTVSPQEGEAAPLSQEGSETLTDSKEQEDGRPESKEGETVYTEARQECR